MRLIGLAVILALSPILVPLASEGSVPTGYRSRSRSSGRGGARRRYSYMEMLAFLLSSPGSGDGRALSAQADGDQDRAGQDQWNPHGVALALARVLAEGAHDEPIPGDDLVPGLQELP